MKKNCFVLACSLLLLAGGTLFAEAESYQAEELASDFLQRLLADGEDWDSALVQEMAAYSQKEQPSVFLQRLLADGVDWDNALVQEMAACLPEEQQKNWEASFKTADLTSPRWLIPFRRNQIAEQAEYLTDKQKEAIYEKSTFSPVGAGFLNLGCGFGIGSFVEGDLFGGLVQVVPPAIASIVLISNLFNSKKEDSSLSLMEDIFLPELVTNLVTRAVGFALPFVFSAVCNKTMQNSLGVDKKGRALPAKDKTAAQNLSVMPLLNPVGNEYGFVALLQL